VAVPSATDRWLVVGLGNPGPDYAGNRHNLGFMVLDVLAARENARFKAHKALKSSKGSDVVEGRLAGVPAVLAKPRSYMNESGGPVAALRDFFRVELERIVVVHDDLDLDFGVVRAKQGGGAGGHNGLRSITRSLGGSDYLRVRVGIGRPPGRMDPADFVLRDFSAAERKELGVVVERGADAVASLIACGLAATQNTFHAN
jgi:PTH1 family peptidyl-tRNA hydrolase